MIGIDHEGRAKTIVIKEGEKVNSVDDLKRRIVKKIPELHKKNDPKK